MVGPFPLVVLHVWHARRVVEHLADRDVPVAGVSQPKVREVVGDAVFERELALLHQLDHGGGHEWLGHGRHVEHVLRRERLSRLDAAHAERTRVDHLAVLHDGSRQARDSVGLDGFLEAVADPVGQ